jgi:nucleoside-diphosphate-sugar epimerase
MPKILVTGANGFIGRKLSVMLDAAGHEVIPVSRQTFLSEGSASRGGAFASKLPGADAVVHLAARAHVIVERHADPLMEFRRANVDGSTLIARAAIEARIPRLVFVSSIGVLGNNSGNRVFTEDTAPSPVEPYAVSKLEAEQALREIESQSPLDVVIVRPPLVYGPGVRGNFLRLLHLVASGIPLPLGSISNLRSYVGLHNLCELLLACALHPAAKGQLFVAADGQDVSTPDLLSLLASAMGRRSRLMRCPVAVVSRGMRLMGMGAEFSRLAGNLRVDASYARSRLGWQPTRSLRDGLEEMAISYLNRRR